MGLTPGPSWAAFALSWQTGALRQLGINTGTARWKTKVMVRTDLPGKRQVLPVTVAIPTYGRDRVLTNTIEYLLRLDAVAAEILVLDQTPAHGLPTTSLLEAWSKGGQIRWLRLPRPSIPSAMNRGLLEATQDIVLFLDDDIEPFPTLVGAHAEAQSSGSRLVAGRVLQPWDVDDVAATWTTKQFASTQMQQIDSFMGGNFSLGRTEALELGGFDENFVRVAYHFEREFADRWRAGGGKILFCPDAAIRHLKAASGGTRVFGEHLTTLFPAHSVGAYYYLLRSRCPERRVREFVGRPFRAVLTRHHLRRPWWIPVTLVAEFTGMLWALALYARGPRLCSAKSRERG
jgi:GT2 family glycosyltransferase